MAALFVASSSQRGSWRSEASLRLHRKKQSQNRGQAGTGASAALKSCRRLCEELKGGLSAQLALWPPPSPPCQAFSPQELQRNGRRSPSWREHRRQLFNHKRRLSEFTGVKSSCLNVQQVPAHNSPAADAKTKPLVCHRTVSGSFHMYKYSFPDVFHCAMGRRPGPPSSHSVWDRLQQLLEGI